MRLAGRQKLGYYPLPPVLAAPIARLLTTAGPTARLRLLDPCCGEGTALKLLAGAISRQHAERHGRYAACAISTWGIEIDQVRAKAAAGQLDHVLAASYFATTLSTGNGQDQGWQLCYVNSIYDEVAEVLEQGEQGGRQEVQFLKRSTDRLCDFGIAIWVIPQHVLLRRGVAAYLAEHYDRHCCYRFPDASWRPPGSTEDVGMYAQFKQVIWIGRKLPDPGPVEDAVVAQIESWAHAGEHLPALPLDGDGLPEPYLLPNAPTAGGIKYFVAAAFDPNAAAARVGQWTLVGRPAEGVWATDTYWSARFPSPDGSQGSLGRPLHALKKGYVIAFAVAGLVNRAILVGKSGRRLLVKGHTRKVVKKRRIDDGIEIVEKETEQYESSLWGLDLDTMQLALVEVGQASTTKWGVPYDKLGMKEFLAEFGDSLMEQVQRQRAPRYQGPHQVPWAKAAFGYLRRRPLGRQLDAILAQVHALVNRVSDPQPRIGRLAEVAEMGAGKTYMAIVSSFLADLYACGCAELAPPGTRKLHLFPLIVLSPPVMAPKWKREIEETLPAARVLIVERFGPRRRGSDEDDEGEEDRDLRAVAEASGQSGGRTAFRQFDPSFEGDALGVVGSLDQAVACIRREISEWRARYAQVLAHNREARAAGAPEADLWPVPLKPTHVLILTFHVARTMPAWMPVWRMKPARIVERQSGKVKLLRRRAEKLEDATPIFFPACPSCLRLAKDEQPGKRSGGFSLDLPEPLPDLDERAREGRERGLQLLAAEERLRQYLLTVEAYADLAQEEAALQAGKAPSDATWRQMEEKRLAYLETLPDYQRLRTARVQAEEAENSERAREAMSRLERLVAELPVQDARYRDLIVRQDQRFRELQRALIARMEDQRAQLARSDETYRQLLQDCEAASDEWRRQRFRVAAYEAEVRESTTDYLTEAALRGKKDHRVRHRCPECGEPLWQYVPKVPKDYQPYSVQDTLPATRTTFPFADGAPLEQWTPSRRVDPLPLPGGEVSPRYVTTTWRRPYALGRYLARRYPGVFGMLVSDEVHEGADKTALSRARQVLAQACRQMLGLTGTLSNGYASSLFRLYYILMPGVRQEFAYDGERRWIGLHGKMQTITKSRYKEKEAAKRGVGAESNREVSPGMPVTREIPGFNATGMGRVAQVSSLTELTDVVKKLVRYEERYHLVGMGDELCKAYQQFQREITRKMRDLLHSGDNSGLSPWYHALMTVGDLPWQNYRCQTKGGEILGVFHALPAETVWPIETALIRYVQEQHTEGHRVLVFTEHTGDYDEQPRIKDLLERYVRGRGGRRLRVEILRATSTKRTMDREAWLARAVERGVDVLVCNPRLVKVGLDLLAFPKIVYKSFPDKVTDFRQSARRSWRPGQTEDVEVVILCYEEALSLRLLHLMARKTAASLMVEGHIASEGLVQLGFDEEETEGDLTGQLAREMLKELEAGTLGQTTDLATDMQQLALDAARLEHEQHERLGEEPDAAAIFLEEIRQVPLVLPPPLPPLGEAVPTEASEPAAALPETPLVEDVQDDTQPAPVPVPVPVPALASPSPTPAGVPVVTIVPMPVTMPNPILAEAGIDAWAELRKFYGVGGKKKRPSRKR